jgi:HK97 family phage major capsid protein
VANNLTTASIETKLLQKMDTLEKRLHESAKPDGSRASDRNLVATWGGGQREGNGWVDGWPVERLRRVAESYDSASAMHMMKGNNGRCRLSGMGPALVKMATLALGSKLTGQELPNSYDENTLERETGFITYQKARRDGRKGLSGQITKTALAEGSGQTGGYLIPPQFQNELLTIAAEDAFIEPRAKVLPMNSRTAQWPMLDITTTQATGVTPYFGGVQAQWQPEAATINEFEPAFKQSEWTAWDLVLFTLASNQILADNGIGLDALLTQLFGAAMVWFKEYAFLQGKGAGNSMPLGILNAPATYVQNRGTPATFKLADAAAMMSHLQIRSWDDACWIMHQSVIPQLIQMVDNASSNRLVWMNPVMPGQVGAAASKLPNAFLNGLPLFFTEKLPSLGTKGDVMLVDWSRYVIGQRLDVQIDVSPHFKFQNNQLAWRVVARCDGKPWLNSTIQDAAGFTVSPFICLN